MPFTLVWLFLFVAHGSPGTLTMAKPYPNEQACNEEIERYKDRMGDFIKGRLNVPLAEEIEVKGVCTPVGVPA